MKDESGKKKEEEHTADVFCLFHPSSFILHPLTRRSPNG